METGQWDLQVHYGSKILENIQADEGDEMFAIIHNKNL
jgi:hypothetical protein